MKEHGDSSQARRKRERLKKKTVPYLYISPTVIFMLLLMFVPVVMVIGYSLMDNVIMNQNPAFVGIEHYIDIFTDSAFHTAVGNTAVFTGLSVVFHLVLGLAFAMLLNTRLISKRTRAAFRVIYITPWVFTSAIIAILWRLMLNPNGVINYVLMELNLISEKVEWLASRDTALMSVTLINIWAGYPFYMISMLAGLQGIPADLYEAATVDGANGPARFVYVTIPQLKPIIVSMAMLDCIWTMQQFNLVWMTTGGGPIRATEMLSTYTYKFAFSSYEFSAASASAVIVLIFSMCLAVLYVRHQKARD